MYRIYAFLLIAVLLVVTVRGQDENTCPWRLRVTTGWDEDASTNATMSASISITEHGSYVWTEPDINTYNVRRNEEDYVPFRRGQADAFEFLGSCDQVSCYFVHFENSGTGTSPSWQLSSAEADVTFPGTSTATTYKYNYVVWIGDENPSPETVTTTLCM